MTNEPSFHFLHASHSFPFTTHPIATQPFESWIFTPTPLFTILRLQPPSSVTRRPPSILAPSIFPPPHQQHPPLPVLKQHPPSLPKQHPPFSPKQHPPPLEKQHPPISEKQHPPLVLQQHPGASSSLARASASRAWYPGPGPGMSVGDIGGGGLYGCWCAWCEEEEEGERLWGWEVDGGVVEVADS